MFYGANSNRDYLLPLDVTGINDILEVPGDSGTHAAEPETLFEGTRNALNIFDPDGFTVRSSLVPAGDMGLFAVTEQPAGVIIPFLMEECQGQSADGSTALVGQVTAHTPENFANFANEPNVSADQLNSQMLAMPDGRTYALELTRDVAAGGEVYAYYGENFPRDGYVLPQGTAHCASLVPLHPTMHRWSETLYKTKR